MWIDYVPPALGSESTQSCRSKRVEEEERRTEETANKKDIQHIVQFFFEPYQGTVLQTWLST